MKHFVHITAMLIIAAMMGCSSASVSKASRSTVTSFNEEKNDPASNAGRIETVSYDITYNGTNYHKDAEIYVPSSYTSDEPLNILYLMHGSTGSGEGTAEAMKPLFDEWIENGTMRPMLVVFPTYYPDRSYVVSNYTQDYPLNHFFATEEVRTVMETVENHYHTYAESTTDEGLSASRMHRAFGGYSMGGITTWDVLAYQSSYFGYYVPMAGDCWLDRVTDAADDSEIADLLVKDLSDHGYTSDDFHIIAMVGENDGTKYSMIPQIEALRKEHSDLINDDNLVYWENEGGGHSEESFEAETGHAMSYLFS